MTPSDRTHLLEICAEVERLHEAATPEPWKADLDIFTEDAEFAAIVCDEPISFLASILTSIKNDCTKETVARANGSQEMRNALLIARYRSLAVEAARALHPFLDCEYRPGLPTAEQVRAHEKQGGWWMMIQREGGTGKTLGLGAHRLRVMDGHDLLEGRIFLVDPVTERMREIAELPTYEARPCLPDGTPVAWSSLDGQPESSK